VGEALVEEEEEDAKESEDRLTAFAQNAVIKLPM
jgi:hypothetical protein